MCGSHAACVDTPTVSMHVSFCLHNETTRDCEYENSIPLRTTNKYFAPRLFTCRLQCILISRVIGVPDVKNWPMLTRCLIAEFIGTLLLVLIGCMSIAFSKTDNFLDVVKIALTFGLIIATMVQVAKLFNYFTNTCSNLQ
ncbi:unnamed protein product [Bemisia tabaci]|uniref:Uncharacterized protein n=1 Tax=Bemisia tabaci TaxID=7038 RepID=A0A9P0AEH6_BEMTA|nr:unnamed protein product [Bemisia tabaci]